MNLEDDKILFQKRFKFQKHEENIWNTEKLIKIYKRRTKMIDELTSKNNGILRR